MTAATPLWAEGRAAWEPLERIPQLASLLATASHALPPGSSSYAAPAAKAAVAAAAAPRHSVAAAAAAPRAAVGAAASSSAADPLAAFKAEIQALASDKDGSGAAPALAGAPEGEAAQAGEAPGTPEEREFEDDDGTIYSWDPKLRKFLPKAGQPASEYNPEDMVFVADELVIPALPVAEPDSGDEAWAKGDWDRDGELPSASEPDAAGDGGNNKKRRGAPAEGAAAEGAAGGGPMGKEDRRKAKKAKRERTLLGQEPAPGSAQAGEQQGAAGWFEMKHNTSVYVTGLPDDVTAEEVAAVFAKCGILKPGEDGVTPKIKIYRDRATGAVKGDGVVTYLKEPSVALACQILDGAPFRVGMGTPMSVTPAQFQMKGEQFVAKAKPKGPSKKALEKRVEKMLGWFGADDKLPAEKVCTATSSTLPGNKPRNLTLAAEPIA